MEWICMLIGLFVGFLLGAICFTTRQNSDGIERVMHDALRQIHNGQEAHFNIIVGKYSGDDGGDDKDVIPDPVLSSDRWRDN
jgi:hypothetical protein